jgi:hypothetical protein
MRNATWPVAAGSLLLGFGVAQASGVRALGGIVLVAGAGWCALRWRRSVGPSRTAALLLVYAGAFAGSHVIADTVGRWPALLLGAASPASPRGRLPTRRWRTPEPPPSGRPTFRPRPLAPSPDQSWPRSTSTPLKTVSTGSLKRQPLISSWRMNVGGSTRTFSVYVPSAGTFQLRP